MNHLIFIFEEQISIKKSHFTVRLAEMTFQTNKWVPSGPKKIYYAQDLPKLFPKTKDINILKKAIQSEITFKKREGRFTSLNAEMTRLRIENNYLPEFLTKTTKQKTLCRQNGEPILFNPHQYVKTTIKFHKDKDCYIPELLCGELNIKDIELMLNSAPMIAITKKSIFQLNKLLTQKLLHSIPINKKINLKEHEELINRILKFKNIIHLDNELQRKNKIMKNPPCLPIMEISEDLYYGRLFFEYPEKLIISYSNSQNSFIQNNVKIFRNKEEEEGYLQTLKQVGITEKPNKFGNWYLPSVKTQQILKSLEEEGWDLRMDNKPLYLNPDIKYLLSVMKNDIIIDTKIRVNNSQIDPKGFFQAIDQKQSFFISNNQVILLPKKDIQTLNSFKKQGIQQNHQLYFTNNNFGYLSQIANSNKAITIDENFKSLQTFENDYKNIEEITIADTLKQTLRPYQKQGINWLGSLIKYNFNGILADDMGLGKTLQILTLLDSILKKGQLKTSLLIVPTSLIFNWEIEIQKFTPEISYHLHTGNDRHNDLHQLLEKKLIITSYALFLRDYEHFKDQNWMFLLLDEAQVVKNPAAKTTKAIKTLNARHKICISGTPVENSPIDLWSHFNFLMPDLLGKLPQFKEKYLQGDNKQLKELNSKTKPFILRRLKTQVLNELPPKTEITQYCDFNEEQHTIYQNILTGSKKQIEDIKTQELKQKTFSILEIILRLRQVACHPHLAKQGTNKKIISGKEELIIQNGLEILSEGHKILIFSQFVEHLKLIRKSFSSHKVENYYLDGSTRNRQEVIEKFNSTPNPAIFFISLKAGGVGLNLTAASYVFLIDPWWNPLKENQAIDRCYRIGQENPVTVYKYITKNSIEEKIAELQKEKINMEQQLITSSENQIPFKVDTLKEIILNI